MQHTEIIPYRFLDELTYCLEADFPAPVTAAMLKLAENDGLIRLRKAHDAWLAWTDGDREDFIEAIEEITGYGCVFCNDCDALVRERADDGLEVCTDCISNYSYCDYCEAHRRGDMTDVGDRTYCQNCLESQCTYCHACQMWIEDCDENHGHPCECEAPHRHFQFPNDGHGMVSEGERFTVELPKGTIDEQGLRAITNLVQQTINGSDNPDHQYIFFFPDMDEVGVLWQTKKGNFTRRLSSMLYKKHKFKLPPEVISEVGNLGRAHSSDAASWEVEFTRDLNRPAEDFCHDDSCWFTDGSYGASRCALKQWGGLALRTFSSTSYHDFPTGRAWVQPLNEDLEPTHDIINAHAYVVYNGYGEMEARYVAARIVAHLTGRTYRKIQFTASPQFINGESGYLVADEKTCRKTGVVSYSYDEHETLDADEIEKVKVYA